MGSKPKTPKVPEVNISGDIYKYVQGMSSQMPTIFASEAHYRPQFQGLNLGDVSAFLQGVGGQQGILGLLGQTTGQTGEMIGEARGTELGQMTGQAGQARGLMQAVSPEGAAQVQRAQQEAQRAYGAAQGLTPQEQRMAQQQAREAYGARGMLGSSGSVAAEILNRENVLAAKRQEAAHRGQEAFGYSQQFYTQPGLSVLGQVPLSYQAAQQNLGLGLGAIGAGTPHMYDISTALNIGAAQRANQVQAQAAGAQAKAAYSGGLFGGIGNVVGSGIGALSAFSDRRLKFDITQVGKTPSGLNTYTFRYKFAPETLQYGVMADEVEKVIPEAVFEVDGYKAVNYSMIH